MRIDTDRPTRSASPTKSISSSNDTNCYKLRACAQTLLSVTRGIHDAAHVFREYTKLDEAPRLLCEALLRTPLPDRDVLLRPRAPIRSAAGGASGLDFNLSNLSLSDQSPTASYFPPHHLEAIREWERCLASLVETSRASLSKTYRTYERDATAAAIEQLFHDKSFRASEIHRMRSASASRSSSARVDSLPNYEISFNNHDKLVRDLAGVRALLCAGESGICLGRTIQDITISPRCDAILEFANNVSESHPVYRFRVSSHMLAETSPLFAYMFSDGVGVARELDGAVISNLPAQPAEFPCEDGSQVKLYRMPQVELNRNRALELLLHAAHMHNDLVPREIDFDQLVALAEVCLRYQCTSPVELSVEYRWLPQWIHKATEDMPEGLLLVSYAFGLRSLFTRTSKSVVLNIVDEDDLRTALWPQRVKDKIWALRNAKIAQIYACCSNALHEYLPRPVTPAQMYQSSRTRLAKPGSVPSARPRCPKGSHLCDASSLGWLMMAFGELQVLPHIMPSTPPSQLPPSSRRSLSQLANALRSISTPPQNHGGICDFSAFRSALNDIFHSVQGLTLFEASGKHGWALSSHKVDLPQPKYKLGNPAVGRMAQLPLDTGAEIALRIMERMDDWTDVCGVALVCKAFYKAFKSNEDTLRMGLKRKGAGSAQYNLDDCITGMQMLRVEAGGGITAMSSVVAVGGSRADADDQRSENKVLVVDSDDEEDGNGDSSSDALPRAHRAPSVQTTIAVSSIAMDEESTAGMTREEAERILWPDEGSTTCETTGCRGASEDKSLRQPASEKFLAGDFDFNTPVENKHLVAAEDKYPRVVRDHMMGLLL